MRRMVLCFILLSISLSADDSGRPERPGSVPEDAAWHGTGNEKYWEYRIDRYEPPFVRWYSNGNLKCLVYNTADKKFRITENYYENGSLKEVIQEIDKKFLNDNHNRRRCDSSRLYIGKEPVYNKNGTLKDDRCYTPYLKKGGRLVSVLCGTEVFYDETGKEVKRVVHETECEYGCDDAERIPAAQVIAEIQSHYVKKKLYQNIGRWEKSPVVGKITDIYRNAKEVIVSYNKGFVMDAGDQVCVILSGEKIIFECKRNTGLSGVYLLKTDDMNLFPSLKKDMPLHFFKKNEIQNEEFLKPSDKAKPGDVKTIGNIEFVYIPAGEFRDSGGRHTARVKAFWITKYEMTLGEYMKFVYETDAGTSYMINDDVTLNSRYPVIFNRVEDWGSCNYCEWFSSKYGVKARLPIHSEWRYATRAGSDGRYYWGSSNMDDYCWYKKNSGGSIHPVGQKKPNAFGLFDMVGNAWESVGSGDGSQLSIAFSITGGSWGSDERDLQYDVDYYFNYEYCEDKGFSVPYEDKTGQGVGFRMVISAE